MTTPPLFPGFDGLMTLSRREGVDIRPTLLRVLTDLYVQTSRHSPDEERQFVELALRLIDQVDDATRAAVRARLAIYPTTPLEIMRGLALKPASNEPIVAPTADVQFPPPESKPMTGRPASDAQTRLSALAMQPAEAAQICDMFFRANTRERTSILHRLGETPLKAAPRLPAPRAARAAEALEMAAWVADIENFTIELGEVLILPSSVAQQVVNDAGGEPLACAMKALSMPGPQFARVLLFLKPDLGASVEAVYRLSRLYDRLTQHSTLVMLAAWRGSSVAVSRAKYRPMLHDDERQRARPRTTQPRPISQPSVTPAVRSSNPKR